MDGESSVPQGGASSYVEWSAVIAGAALACAISFVLLTFGGAIGLSLTSPYRGEGMPLIAFTISTGLWVLWVEIASFMAGGYLAGRMRRRLNDSTEHEVDVRDRAHGLLVWASGVLLGAVLAFSGVGGAGSTAAKAALAATQATSQGVNPILIDLFRPLVGAAHAANADERASVAKILLNANNMSAGDRAYAVSAVASETGVSPAEADQRVSGAQRASIDAANAARHAADIARKLAVLTAFFLAASLLVSAAAASVAAAHGGEHRDKAVIHPWLVTNVR